jgi:hypothetical protein
MNNKRKIKNKIKEQVLLAGDGECGTGRWQGKG